IEGGWGKRVKEKQQRLANIAEKDIVVVSSPAVDEPVEATVNTEDVNVGQTPTSPTVNPKLGTSYAKLFTAGPSRKAIHFRTLFTPRVNGVDVVVSVESIRAISARFANTGKYGLVKSMLNSSTGIFYFEFSSIDGLDAMLENVIMEYLVNIFKRRAFWSLNKDISKITVLTTNAPYPSKKIRCICACTYQRQGPHDQYAVSNKDQCVVLEI
ncbi:hypothetical protein Tco_0422505, partial [Tanacetum coccineum]